MLSPSACGQAPQTEQELESNSPPFSCFCPNTCDIKWVVSKNSLSRRTEGLKAYHSAFIRCFYFDLLPYFLFSRPLLATSCFSYHVPVLSWLESRKVTCSCETVSCRPPPEELSSSSVQPQCWPRPFLLYRLLVAPFSAKLNNDSSIVSPHPSISTYPVTLARLSYAHAFSHFTSQNYSSFPLFSQLKPAESWFCDPGSSYSLWWPWPLARSVFVLFPSSTPSVSHCISSLPESLPPLCLMVVFDFYTSLDLPAAVAASGLIVSTAVQVLPWVNGFHQIESPKITFYSQCILFTMQREGRHFRNIFSRSDMNTVLV